MRCIALIMAGMLWVAGALAQEQMIDLDQLAASAEQWARDNLDEDILKALESCERKSIESLFANLNQQFRGEYVLDLAQLKAAAKTVLPLLESYEETLPYAVWLKTRMDYFDVADQLDIVPFVLESGARAISVDQKNDVAESRAKLGPQALIFGNYDPYNVLVAGTPELVRTTVGKCIDDGVSAVWPGCDIWPTVPPENVKATLDEAKSHKR